MENRGVIRLSLGIIGLAIAFLIFPIILDGAIGIVTDPQTDTFAGVVDSGTPTYQATVELTQDLYEDSTNNIASITSNSGTDTPVSGAYTAASGSLVVTGLNAGAPGTASRTLDVAYSYDSANEFTGLDAVVMISPLIIFVGLLLGSGLAIYSGARASRTSKGHNRPKYG